MLANRAANEIYFRLKNVELLIGFQKKKKKILPRGFFCLSGNFGFWKAKNSPGFHKNSRFKYFHNTNFHDLTSEMSLLEIFPGLQSLRRKLLSRHSTSCRTKILLQFSKVQKIPVPNFKTCRFKISRNQKFYTSAHCRTSSDQPAPDHSKYSIKILLLLSSSRKI